MDLAAREMWPFPMLGGARTVDESTVTEHSGGGGGGRTRRKRKESVSEDESSKLVSTSSGNELVCGFVLLVIFRGVVRSGRVWGFLLWIWLCLLDLRWIRGDACYVILFDFYFSFYGI